MIAVVINVIDEHRTQLASLCVKYQVVRLDVIGSAIRDDFRDDQSDIDFVVQFDDLTPANAADRYFGLLVDLEDLFGRKIDLISYTAIRNPYFKQVVDQTRVSLYAA
jgi:predicted nucleotidyltransferase